VGVSGHLLRWRGYATTEPCDTCGLPLTYEVLGVEVDEMLPGRLRTSLAGYTCRHCAALFGIPDWGDEVRAAIALLSAALR